MSPEDQTGTPAPEPFFKASPADEVTDELAFHVDMRVRELVGRGIAPDVAWRMARDRFDDLTRVAAECHQLARQREHAVNRTRYVTNLLQDIRFALRMLRRRPAFALLAIATIGLGIGAATAIYSVVDGVMLRPLPFSEPGNLVAVWITEQRFHDDPTLSSMWDHIPIGAEEYHALQDARSLRDVALWGKGSATLTTTRGVQEVSIVRATSNLLSMLHVRPVLGRGFLPGEDILDGPRVALLSWEAWQRTWNSDTALVGRSILLGTSNYTVVGILPRGLRMDRSEPIAPVWLPALRDSSDRAEQHNRSYRALARLAPGTTLSQATREASQLLLGAAIASRGAVRAKGVAGRVETWQVDQTRQVRASLWILFGAVVLLLLIACTNVAMLMIGEAVRRKPEVGARVALGAAPSRITRQLLTEGVTISLLGAVVGAAVAWGSVRMLVALAPSRIPGIDDVRIDLRVLGFAAVCALVTGLIFGVTPALVLLRRGANATIRVGAGQTPRGMRVLQSVMIATESALSLILLVGCTLLGRSLLRITTTDPGFQPKGLLVVGFSQLGVFWRDDDRQRRFYAAATRELAAIPGVESVSANSVVPFNGNSTSSPVKVDDRAYLPGESEGNSQQRIVLPDYFHTMGIPLLAGRAIDASDRQGAELSVVVSETEARRDWPHTTPIGHRLFWQGKWRTVIGIVGDIKYQKLSRDYEPTVYIPFDQEVSSGELVVRVRLGMPGIDAAIRSRLSPLDAAVTIESVKPMTELIGRSYAEERYRALLSSLFGLLAGALAAIGVFGVISRTVAQRAREMGIRLALGAPAIALTRLMMRDAAAGVVTGLGIGLAGSLFVAHLLTPYLFGVTAYDPLTFAAAVGLLSGALLLAILPPARQAGRVDPVTVLRTE